MVIKGISITSFSVLVYFIRLGKSGTAGLKLSAYDSEAAALMAAMAPSFTAVAT